MATRLLRPQFSQTLPRYSRSNATVAALKQQTSTKVTDTEWANAKPFSALPGPKRWPIIGTAWQFLPLIGINIPPTRQLELNQYLIDKFGRIGVNFLPGYPPLVWVSTPEDVETVFRNEGRFPVRLGFETLKIHRQQRPNQFSATGLLVAQGEDWWKIRSKAQQPMLKPKNIYSYLPVINEIGDDFIDRIRLIRQENNEMKPDFLNEMYRWALESVAVVALNTRLGCLSPTLAPDSEAQKMITAVNTSFLDITKLEVGFPLWRIMTTPSLRRLFKAQDFFAETSVKYINATIEKIKSRPEDSDEEQTILEQLLLRGMSLQDAVVMVIDMLMAGIDTTSHTTSFLFYFLAKNPEKQELLRKEVLSVVGPRGSPISLQALNELRYLKACIKESLRLMPATSGNARVVDNDVVLSGYQVPKGSMAIVLQQWMSIQEEYVPRALEYIPERWIKGHELESKVHPYVMLPFGFGTRMCIGRRLAEMEMWQLTVKCMQNFRVEYDYEDIGCEFRMVNVPDKPLKFKLIDIE
nr:CYP362A6 protein [Diaphanosoma celebensis]